MEPSARAFVSAGLGLAVCIGVLAAEDPEAYTHVLVSDRVNGVHRDLETDLAPVQIGPVNVVLTSPSHSLEVFEHRLSLGAAGDGADLASLRARYQGQAHLVAELEVAGMKSQIEDSIEVPLQETEIAGRLEIAREDSGYRVTVVEVPKHVLIQVESDLAGRVALLCQGFAVMAMGNVDCEAVDQAMSVVKVPLPEPGEEFWVASEDLTPHEREQVDKYLLERRD